MTAILVDCSPDGRGQGPRGETGFRRCPARSLRTTEGRNVVMSEEGSAWSRVSTRLSAAAEAARSRRGLITLALLLAMTVTALEQTVVSTAMPSIIASLNGVEIYS